MKKVLVVENVEIVSLGIGVVLTKVIDLSKILFAASVSRALDLVDMHDVDLIFIDSQIVGVDAEITIQELQGRSKKLKIVILEGFKKHFSGWAYIIFGANCFLSKKADEAQFLSAIANLRTAPFYLDRSVHEELSAILGNANTDILPLTNREIQVVQLLFKGYCTKEIAASLAVRQETVVSYRIRILVKFQVDSLPDLFKKMQLAFAPRACF